MPERRIVVASFTLYIVGIVTLMIAVFFDGRPNTWGPISVGICLIGLCVLVYGTLFKRG